MTDHTRTEKIGGDSILIFVVIQVVAGNCYDNKACRFMFIESKDSITINIVIESRMSYLKNIYIQVNWKIFLSIIKFN